MAAKKIKAEVRINDGEWNGEAIVLHLTAYQSVAILKAIVAGEDLRVNLVTEESQAIRESPAAYAVE